MAFDPSDLDPRRLYEWTPKAEEQLAVGEKEYKDWMKEGIEEERRIGTEKIARSLSGAGALGTGALPSALVEQEKGAMEVYRKGLEKYWGVVTAIEHARQTSITQGWGNILSIMLGGVGDLLGAKLDILGKTKALAGMEKKIEETGLGEKPLLGLPGTAEERDAIAEKRPLVEDFEYDLTEEEKIKRPLVGEPIE